MGGLGSFRPARAHQHARLREGNGKVSLHEDHLSPPTDSLSRARHLAKDSFQRCPTINTALSTRLAADLVARTLRLNALYAGGRAPIALPRALPARLGISPQYARTRAQASGQDQKHRIGRAAAQRSINKSKEIKARRGEALQGASGQEARLGQGSR
jgi:hypothetical protein